MSAAPPLTEAAPTLHHRIDAARVLVRRGHIRAAADAVAEPVAGLRGGRTTSATPLERAHLLALEMECRLAQGDLSAALDVGELLDPLSTAPGAAGAVALHARAELAAALGEAELAVDRYLASGDADDSGLVPWRSGAALALLRLGRRREALDLARAHLSLVAGGPVHEVATALRTLATTDPDGRGVPRLREAEVLLVDADAERLQAQVRTDLAGLLVLTGQAHDAVVLLRSAEAYAAREDLWPLQSRIRRLLERLGETPRQAEAEALAALTAAERRVVLLAIDGLTNRRIADQLGVSVKAVEGHLSKVYRKLGIGSRAALATRLRNG